MTTIFTAAFLAAERELGARIGYPALVYDQDIEAIAIAKVKAMFDHDYCIHCGVEVPAPGSCEACEAWWSDPSPLYVNEAAAAAYLASKAVSLPNQAETDERELEETRGVLDRLEALVDKHGAVDSLIASRDDALDTIAQLRADLDDAHQHVGALIKDAENIWDILTELITASTNSDRERGRAALNRALDSGFDTSAARAWLRRGEGGR